MHNNIMRKILLLVTCLCVLQPATAALLSPISVAITGGQWLFREQIKFYQVRVESQGNTFDEAKQEGLRLAVELAVGALVLSEGQVVNGESKRREIITYASGYVDKFEIIERDTTRASTKLVMDVWVGESRIANRLFNNSATAGRIDGERLAVRVESIIHERQSGDRVLSAVLQDFPSRSFDIKLLTTQVSLTNLRQVAINIPFEISWNYNYLLSLYEALEKVGMSGTCSTANILFNMSRCNREQNDRSFLNMHLRPPENLIMGWTGRVGFDDDEKLKSLHRTMVRGAPAIQLVVKNTQGNPVYNICGYMQELDHNVIGGQITNNRFIRFHGREASIAGALVLYSSIELDIRKNPAVLEQLDAIELRVVPKSQCPK